MSADLDFYDTVSSSASHLIFQNARDFVLSHYACSDRFALDPRSLSQRLLRFINQNNSGQDGARVDAMSQYLKLMPDQSDLNAAIDEEDLEQIDSQIDPQFSAASVLGAKQMRNQWMMLLEHYRAYTVAKLESIHSQASRNGR